MGRGPGEANPKHQEKRIIRYLRVLVEKRKNKTVWTSFKIAVKHKLLIHNNSRLCIAYKKATVNIIALL